jgi:D-glycero-alpha-D-manno-heptose-7-phosphate kinase
MNEGGAVLSTTIDKYIFVTAKWRFDHKLRVGYTKTELVENLEEIEHELIREAFRLTGILSGVEITTMGDIPSEGSGLGSSSTVTVGALLALHELRGNRVSTEKLAEDACRIELDILKKPIGIQDQYAAAFGGMRHIEFTQEGIVRLNPVRLSADTVRSLNENLLLFYTGKTRKSVTILEEQRSNIASRTEILKEMKGLVSLAKSEIEAGNLDEIGHMLHYTWVLKKRLASRISNPKIDEMYDAGRDAGALGGKIIGAGGGGFLMLYCPNGTRRAVRAALHHLREQPFQLEPDGAKVILNYPRSVTTNDVAHETRQEFISVKSFVPRSIGDDWVPALANSEPVKKNHRENSKKMNINSHLRTYASDVGRLLDRLAFNEIEEVIRLLQEARFEKRRVFIMGNGGSASTATHFVCDLAKNTRSTHSPDYRVVGLSDNMALFSAYANDDGYSNVFRYQLLAQVEPGDIVIAISTSGNSENVVEAVREANQAGAYTIGFTGFTSGKLGAIVDREIHVDSDCVEQVEDLHLLLEHMIVHTIKAIESQSPEPLSVYEDTEVLELEHAQEMEEPSKQLYSFSSLPEDEKTTRAETLYTFSKIVADPERSEPLVRQLLRTAVETFSATSGSLMLFSEGRLAGEMLSYNGESVTLTEEQQFDVADQGLAAWVREQKLPALIANTRDDPRWLNRTWDEGDSGPRSAMAIPFFHEGKVVGVLTLVRPYGFSFAEREFAVFSAVSHCFSMYGDHIKSEGAASN